MNNVSSIRIMHDTPLIIKCLYISFLVGKIREMYPIKMHEEYTGFKVDPIYGGMVDTSNSSKPHRDFTDADEASTVQQQSDEWGQFWIWHWWWDKDFQWDKSVVTGKDEKVCEVDKDKEPVTVKF